MKVKNDFSQGKISANILRMGVPTCTAQIINLLYSLVDRVYIGHMPVTGAPALTGLGVCLPVISLVTAFTNLCGQGGAPLCSMARGRGDLAEAKRIMGNSMSMLLISGVAVPALCFAFLTPLLSFFGASAETMPYAKSYLGIYLCGTEFVMIASGMNFHINAQGFAKISMICVAVGAGLNIILDPVFIFALGMGVRGAALATVISQAVSAGLTLRFLTGKKAIYALSWRAMRLQRAAVGRIMALGAASFCFGATNSLVQMITNHTLQTYGGDLYIGVMTIAASLRDIFMMVQRGLTQGAQPVLSYNYGAKLYARVRQGIDFIFRIIMAFSTLVCIFVMLYPAALFHIYTSDTALIAAGVPMLRIYMCGFWLMGLQFVGQNTFTALGKPKQAVFFSLLRKVFMVVPITLLLPLFVGTTGVFWAEPISDYLGATACYATMMLTVYRRLGKAGTTAPGGKSGKEGQ